LDNDPPINEDENDPGKFEIQSRASFFAFDDRISQYDCVLLILSTKDPVKNARGSDSRLQDGNYMGRMASPPQDM
jgi:hypothetical protein